MPEKSKEIWKDVVGYEGFYKVSNYGRLKSLYYNRILNRKPDKDGYTRFDLYKNKKWKYRYIHNLVLEAFIGACPKGEESIHLEAVKKNSNNKLSNLRYGSHSCNMAFKHDDGTAITGEKSNTAKLTEVQVKKIRELYQPYKVTQKKLSKKFNVSECTIGEITRGETWQHLL